VVLIICSLFLIDDVVLDALACGFSSGSASPPSIPYHSTGLWLHPDLIEGRVSLERKNWARYRFTSFQLTYTGSCSASTSGQLVLGYVTDPVSWPEATLDTTYLYTPDVRTMSNIRPYAATPVWTNTEFSYKHPMMSDSLFYVRDNTLDFIVASTDYPAIAAKTSYLRNCYQGRIVGLLQDSPVTIQKFGRLWISGTIEYYDPVYTELNNLDPGPVIALSPAESKARKVEEEKKHGVLRKSRENFRRRLASLKLEDGEVDFSDVKESDEFSDIPLRSPMPKTSKSNSRK